MNVKIQALLVQAQQEIRSEEEIRGLAYRDHDKEVASKFAELIVRECAQVSEDDISDGNACCTNTADRIARQIKKHFGVEE